MKIAIVASVIGLCFTITPSPADAQGCRMGHGSMTGAGIGMMGMRGGQMLLDPAQLPALKEKLGITSEQETAWTGYADAAKALWDFHGAMGGPPADRQARREHHDAAWQVHAQVRDARDKLGKALTVEQRQQLDQSVPDWCRR